MTCDHVDVARRAVAQIPGDLMGTRRVEVAENLTKNARRFNAAGASKLAAHLLSVVVPGGRIASTARHERRQGWCTWDG